MPDSYNIDQPTIPAQSDIQVRVSLPSALAGVVVSHSFLLCLHRHWLSTSDLRNISSTCLRLLPTPWPQTNSMPIQAAVSPLGLPQYSASSLVPHPPTLPVAPVLSSIQRSSTSQAINRHSEAMPTQSRANLSLWLDMDVEPEFSEGGETLYGESTNIRLSVLCVYQRHHSLTTGEFQGRK